MSSILRRPLALALSFAAVCGSVLGCSSILGDKDPSDPGTPIGSYHLSAIVDLTSTCTEAVAAAPNPWAFDVTLRRDKDVGYWIANAEPLSGTIDDNGAISFQASSPNFIHDVDKKLGVGACTIVRTDTFGGNFVGPSTTTDGVASFSGTLRYTYSIQAGSDCRDVVGPVADDRPSPLFATLPCDVHFAATAAKFAVPTK